MTKQPPTSLRIPDQTRQRVHAYATERGIPRNAAYVELLERGLAALRKPNSLGPVRTAIREALAENEPTQQPRSIVQPPRVVVDAPFGYQRPKPGSRLKVKK